MQVTKALLASLLAVASAASAAVGGPVGAVQAVVEPAAHVPPVPLLWKVSDGDNALYLLGSFHLLKDGDYPLSADIDRAFAAAEKVVFEIPPEALLDPTTGQRFLEAAAYDDDRGLSDVLSPRMREQLQQLIARQGGTIAQFEGYEPWFVNLSLLMGLSQSLGFSAEQGLDRHLMARAEAAGKPTAGLETFDDQLRALDATPMDEQVIGLAEFIDRPRDMPGVLAKLHQAWRAGDIERLDQLTRVEMLEQTPETYRIVNVERNEAWLPKLQAMLDDYTGDDMLVVVGALHLLGEDGVVAMLRDEGYAVERICSACEVAVVDD
ncbi:TraB/GumN family protein [Novilysobacter erysipheiresistens]|uniref:TraB/GumN family protein n=1 Tax=Novilysobacter erysipheiresistens TaxID=1749332 RepID=A0ABU7YV57_9GAMM